MDRNWCKNISNNWSFLTVCILRFNYRCTILCNHFPMGSLQISSPIRPFSTAVSLTVNVQLYSSKAKRRLNTYIYISIHLLNDGFKHLKWKFKLCKSSSSLLVCVCSCLSVQTLSASEKNFEKVLLVDMQQNLCDH